MERGVRPRRVETATRVSLAVLARLCDWRNALVVVQPATMTRWHRAGWRLVWRLKCRSGRPRIPLELQALIRRIAIENVSWGEERIADELLVKLGIRVSPRTVGKYMPKRPPGQPRGDQRWSTFLKNHAKGILACDFFVAVTTTFRMPSVFVERMNILTIRAGPAVVTKVLLIRTLFLCHTVAHRPISALSFVPHPH